MNKIWNQVLLIHLSVILVYIIHLTILIVTSDGEMAAGLLLIFYLSILFIEFLILCYILITWSKENNLILKILRIIGLVPLFLIVLLYL